MKFLKKINKFLSSPKTYYPNIYIFSYHALKAIHKFLIKLGIIKQKYSDKDMFNWSLYDLHYKGELIEEKKRYTINLSVGDYQIIDNKLTKINSQIKPLHPNHRFLYETIMQLNPASVFEMGCGAGMHLNNLQILAPQINFSGIDLLPKQITRLRRNYPFLNAIIKVADATTAPLPENFLPPADLAFTQAVIMHIHTGDLHLNALENLFKMSKKYVLLHESPKNHLFMDDIIYLCTQKRICWDNLFFYYRINEENKPSSIICSNEKLNYPILEDYNIFSN